MLEEKLQKIVEKSTDYRKVFGTSFCIKYQGEALCVSSGDLKTDSQYFIASTTKLFTTAIILNLRSKGLLKLADRIDRYLDGSILSGLHVLNGSDHSGEISIKNLLAHTSGIPDYFQQRSRDGKSFESGLIKGNDAAWTFENAIEYSKSLRPYFKPAAKKAHYSDTNFQLLGKIIETISGKSISDVYEEHVFEPLQLTQTYLYDEITDVRPAKFYYKSRKLEIPKAMTSFGPDGGIVSTSNDMITFLEAFFGGILFPKEYISELKVWNSVLSFPIQSGIGIHRVKLPRLLNLSGTIPEIFGHSGLSGAMAYHSPTEDLYIAGTVNQVAYPSTSFRLAFKLIDQVIEYYR